MNIIDLPITILDNIIGNINDTETYSNIRLTCTSFYYLLREIKRYYKNKALKELFIFKNGILHGYHIKWYVNLRIMSMAFYINSKKENEYTEYYSSGNLKLVKNYYNGLLHGEEKEYSNYEQALLRKCEYDHNIKINTEHIYNKYGEIVFEKKYLSDSIVTIKYYTKLKHITGTFINGILHGKHITEYFYENNVILNYNKIIKTYDYGELTSVTKYKFNHLIEKINIKNGKKNDWAFKWDDNHHLKSLCYYKDNKYNGKLKLWNKNSVESLDLIQNIPSGFYKSKSQFINKTIPYSNNTINGYVLESIHTINIKYLIKFKHGFFDHIVKKSTSNYHIEIFLDNDYFSYTKYNSNHQKCYDLKLIQNYITFSAYNIYNEKIYDCSKILYDFTPETYI